MNKNVYVVIMAGGSGTRLWPFSRNNFPKQFHDILGTGKTLLQQTFERFSQVCPIENVYVVTNQSYHGTVKNQLPQITDEQILLEPQRKNTAPCIAFACYKIAQRNPDANIVVTPSDQMILKEERFIKRVKKALKYTFKEDVLITLGITPTRPDTNYGYIQIEEDEAVYLEKEVKKVKLFAEKPEASLAKAFFESGDFVWNAGIFIWNVKTIQQAFREHLPEIAEVFEEIQGSFYTDKEENALKKAYSQCKNISIDYGVLMKASNIYVIASDVGWSDLGNWSAIYEASPKDDVGNVKSGKQMLYDTSNCIIKTPKDKLVVIEGLEGMVIAEYDNVLLICRKENEQKIRNFVNDAENIGKEFI
ncbi:MAG: mannose-1-phosphate guanylyltransferase [Cytophagales bacterium]|nr:MAG: mannose-1-phosphate guanylyltransferase [Cytophagales bacterium]